MTPYFNVAVITFAAFLIGLGIIYGLQVCVERQQGGSKGRGGYGGTAGYEGRGSDVSQSNKLDADRFVCRIRTAIILIYQLCGTRYLMMNFRLYAGLHGHTIKSQRRSNAAR